MAKIVIMIGLPASGKSTRAREIVDQGDAVRINRDLLRTMLHFDKWTGLNEGVTRDVARAIADALLGRGRSVVIDDTNLNQSVVRMWVDLAKKHNAKIQYERMNTDMQTCIERDKGREKAVGAHVIIGMALQWGMYPKPEKPIVLCDLDGTLCDLTHRLQYAKGELKNWDKFFQGIPNDKLRDVTKLMLDEYVMSGHQIMFVSARPEKYRAFTMDWLGSNGFFPAQDADWMTVGGVEQTPYHALIMRRDNDKRDDTEVKQQVYDTYFASHEEKKGYTIEVVIDDRPKVIRMWRSNGLEVIDVGSGEEF